MYVAKSARILLEA